MPDIQSAGSPRSTITHHVDVRRFAAQKQAALAAHRSQVYGRAGRLFRLLVALPVPLYGLIAGREWFVERGAATTVTGDDVFAAASRVSPRGR